MPFLHLPHRWLAIVCLLVLAPGCTFSVHPILTEKDMTSDIDLSGTWELQTEPGQNAQPVVITLEGCENHYFYDAVYKRMGTEFEMQIGKIGDHRYLQFVRSDLSMKEDPPLVAHIPVYGFAKFEREGDQLRVYSVRDREVRKLLNEQDVAYRDYQPSDLAQWCIITERTSTLQKLIQDHDKELFQDKPATFRRTDGP